MTQGPVDCCEWRLFVKTGVQLAVLIATVVWGGGCAGKGESVAIDLRRALPSPSATRPAADLTVAIAPFDDAAIPKGRLGSRAHLWGGTSYFDLAGGRPGEVVARVIADTLKKQGWRVESPAQDGKAQVAITGKILELSVNAKSLVGSTDIHAVSKLAVEAVNVADGSKIRMTLTGEGSESVFWFDPEDAQNLLSETVAGSLGKLIASLKVEDGLLRLK